MLEPGASWEGEISARGALVAGSWARVVFGTLVAVGKPPDELDEKVIWITDHDVPARGVVGSVERATSNALRLRLGAAARRHGRAGDLLRDRNELVSVVVAEAHVRAVVADERHVRRAHESAGLANGRLGSLLARRVRRAAAVVLERDPAPERVAHDVGRVVGGDAAELDAARQDEDVRGEAVATLMRREPQVVGGTMSCRAPTGASRRAQHASRVPCPQTSTSLRVETSPRVGVDVATSSASPARVAVPKVSCSEARTTNAVRCSRGVPGRRMNRTRSTDGVRSSQFVIAARGSGRRPPRSDTSRGHVPRTSTSSQFSAFVAVAEIGSRAASERSAQRRLVTGLDDADDVAERDLLPGRDVQLGDDAVAMRDELVLHLHRLDDADELARPHLAADLDGDREHGPLHRARRRRRLPRRRCPCSAPGAACASWAHGGSGVWMRTSWRRPSISMLRRCSRRRVPALAPSSRADLGAQLRRAARELLGLDDPVTGLARDEARRLEERAVEAEEVRRALDDELLERAEHAPPGVLAVDVVHDELRDQRVVEVGDLVARRTPESTRTPIPPGSR